MFSMYQCCQWEAETNGECGDEEGRQIQIYLNVCFSLLETEITGFEAQVSHTDLTKQSPSCSLCQICSAALLGEANFANFELIKSSFTLITVCS